MYANTTPIFYKGLEHAPFRYLQCVGGGVCLGVIPVITEGRLYSIYSTV